MQHFPKNCFHFPESSVKFASSTKNEVRKFGEVRSSSSTEILICNPGDHEAPRVLRADEPRDQGQEERQGVPVHVPPQGAGGDRARRALQAPRRLLREP